MRAFASRWTLPPRSRCDDDMTIRTNSDLMAGSHHPESCTDESCTLAYVDHLRGFMVSAAATPNRRPESARTLVKDRQWDRDLDAYKRLRQDHVQPSSNLGCAELEKTAVNRWDIESKPRMEGET
jgi:hypothetical protein